MKLLTVHDLLNVIPPLTIFATGFVEDGTADFNLAHGKVPVLRWVAKAGAIGDWSVYVSFPDWPIDEIALSGDKINTKEYVQHLVPCTDRAYTRYRH